MDDKEIERLAQQELLQEARRAKSRAEEVGPVGWQRCPLPATNKRFLHNMLVNTLEPRKKKSRQTEPHESKEKVKSCKPVQKERQHKNTTKDKEKLGKNEHKHHRHKSKRKHSNP